ncbi:MAG: hypothetical protein WA142_05920 [Rugosibacter sp.]
MNWLPARCQTACSTAYMLPPTPRHRSATLARLFAMPPGAKPIAILCLGHVAKFANQPTLEALGWGQRLPIESVVFENHWPLDAQPTPTVY